MRISGSNPCSLFFTSDTKKTSSFPFLGTIYCLFVFPSNNGTRMSNRNLFRAFGIATGRANVRNFRFHDLRHTFATRLVRAGVGIYEVQRLGRWKNNSMVMRYAHHNSESLRSSIEVMDESMEPFITILSQSQKKGLTVIG